MTISPQARPAQGAADAAITETVRRALSASTLVPNTVEAHTTGGHVTLTGQVDSYLQRDAAEEAMKRLDHVEAVENRITLIMRSPTRNAEQHIQQAMLRNPAIESSTISVTIIGHTATLTGHVGSLDEKKQAGLATWASPLVKALDNRLKILTR